MATTLTFSKSKMLDANSAGQDDVARVSRGASGPVYSARTQQDLSCCVGHGLRGRAVPPGLSLSSPTLPPVRALAAELHDSRDARLELVTDEAKEQMQVAKVQPMKLVATESADDVQLVSKSHVEQRAADGLCSLGKSVRIVAHGGKCWGSSQAGLMTVMDKAVTDEAKEQTQAAKVQPKLMAAESVHDVHVVSKSQAEQKAAEGQSLVKGVRVVAHGGNYEEANGEGVKQARWSEVLEHMAANQRSSDAAGQVARSAPGGQVQVDRGGVYGTAGGAHREPWEASTVRLQFGSP